MGLIDRIKSALGLDTGPSQPTGGTDGPSPDDDVEVTVEHDPEPEPDTASEDAVKGTDTASGTSAESAGQSDAKEGTTDEAVDADLEDIKGIGPTYAERLREAGIDGVAALADADPETLAADADIAESRVTNWVERARNR